MEKSECNSGGKEEGKEMDENGGGWEKLRRRYRNMGMGGKGRRDGEGYSNGMRGRCEENGKDWRGWYYEKVNEEYEN